MNKTSNFGFGSIFFIYENVEIQMKKKQGMHTVFPDELWLDILRHLGVDDLCTFKLTCKTANRLACEIQKDVKVVCQASALIWERIKESAALAAAKRLPQLQRIILDGDYIDVEIINGLFDALPNVRELHVDDEYCYQDNEIMDALESRAHLVLTSKFYWHGGGSVEDWANLERLAGLVSRGQVSDVDLTLGMGGINDDDSGVLPQATAAFSVLAPFVTRIYIANVCDDEGAKFLLQMLGVPSFAIEVGKWDWAVISPMTRLKEFEVSCYFLRHIQVHEWFLIWTLLGRRRGEMAIRDVGHGNFLM